MSPTVKLAIAAVLIAPMPVVAQGPTPPARYEGPPLADGYDARAVYQRWVQWIEGRKGPVLETALAEPASVEGSVRRGAALIETRGSGDLGLGAVSDVSILCPATNAGSDAAGCRPVVRHMQIPILAADYGQDDTLADWALRNFEPVAVVQALKAAQVPPPGSVWFDMETVFAGLPSPDPVLRAGLKTDIVDGRDCPELGTALSELEGRSVAFGLDLFRVGEDARPPPPPPHSVRWAHTIRFTDADLVVIEAGRSLDALVAPVWAAVAKCHGRG